MILNLAVNTSEKKGQFIIFDHKKIIEEKSWESGQSHSEILTTEFEKSLIRHNLEASSLKKVYCVNGPGSFTGLRVGVNFCKTLSYLNKADIYAINSLEMLSYNCSKTDRHIVATIDAQKNSVFCSIFKIKNEEREPILTNKIMSLKEMESTLCFPFYSCGKGLDKYISHLSNEFKNTYVSEQSWKSIDLKLMLKHPELLKNLTPLRWDELQPLYLKASAPEEKLKEEKV